MGKVQIKRIILSKQRWAGDSKSGTCGQKQMVRVGDTGRCCASGLEDGGRGHEPRMQEVSGRQKMQGHSLPEGMQPC